VDIKWRTAGHKKSLRRSGIKTDESRAGILGNGNERRIMFLPLLAAAFMDYLICVS
jgi:hypothetical protein